MREYKHIRYMWIPYSDVIVVVRSKPLQARTGAAQSSKSSQSPGRRKKQSAGSRERGSGDEKSTRALCRLLCSLTPSCERHVRDATSADAARRLYRRAAPASAKKAPLKAPLTEEEVARLSFTELRDELLALDPLDAGHVAEVNRAEAEFWSKSQGFR